MNDVEIKRAKYNKYGKVALMGLAALVVAPIIFLVVKGLVGLIIAGVIGLVAINVAPVLSMKLANWKVKGIVAEAKQNPIESRIVLVNEKKLAFAKFQTSVQDAVTGYKTFTQKIEEFKKLYPHRAAEFSVQADAMGKLVQRKQDALKQAQLAIRESEAKLVELKAYWEISQIALAANKASGMDTGDQFEQLKLDVTQDSVFESMNRAFAEMEVAASLSEPVGIANNPSPTLQSVVSLQKDRNVINV